MGSDAPMLPAQEVLAAAEYISCLEELSLADSLYPLHIRRSPSRSVPGCCSDRCSAARDIRMIRHIRREPPCCFPTVAQSSSSIRLWLVSWLRPRSPVAQTC